MAPAIEHEVEGSKIVQTSVKYYQTIRCNAPNDRNIRYRICENFKPRIAIIWYSKEQKIFQFWITDNFSSTICTEYFEEKWKERGEYNEIWRKDVLGGGDVKKNEEVGKEVIRSGRRTWRRSWRRRRNQEKLTKEAAEGKVRVEWKNTKQSPCDCVVLSAFPKFRNATTSFFMSVCLSVCPSVFLSCPHRSTRFRLDEFLWNLLFHYFSKISPKIQVLLKHDKNNDTVREDINIYICDINLA
jgi:hypothetical protein